MSYDIYPQAIKAYVEDKQIKLPRFQRKSTWKNKQRFNLVLSIFKNYPIGASIIFSESVNGKITSKWLLDGRQRRETLEMMFNDPEKIFEWASSSFKFGDSASFNNNFYKYVDEFVEQEKNDDNTDEVIADDKPMEETKEENTRSNTSRPDLSGLNQLLYIAKYHKGKNGSNSGITNIFNFKKFLNESNNLRNQLYDEKFEIVEGRKLRKFLRQYVDKYSDNITFENFTKYLDETFEFKDGQKTKFITQNKTNWNLYKYVIDIFAEIDQVMFNGKVAIIETRDIKSNDTQKIFQLINKGGTPLSASEIISAKSVWNQNINDVSVEMENSIKKLYESLGNLSAIKEGNYVRWDFPASLYYILENSGIKYFFDYTDDDDVSNKISIGFKILSGIYVDGVKKDDFDKLVLKLNFDDTSKTIEKLKKFFNLFNNNVYLNNLKSWGKSLNRVTSEGAALNYILILYKNWVTLGEPSSFVGDSKIFNKNAFVQLDKTFYEYITRFWRGSSDAIISNNLATYNYTAKLFDALEEKVWANLIEDIIENNTLNQNKIVKDELKTLIYYYNILKNIVGDYSQAEVDHIIPKREWSSSVLQNKESIMNNLYNLALLPNGQNSAKNDQLLSTLASKRTPALNEILRYEEIEREQIDLFSNPSEYEKIKKIRGDKFKQAYSIIRKKIIES